MNRNAMVLIAVLILEKSRKYNGRSLSCLEISRLRGMVETNELMEIKMVDDGKPEVA